MSAVDRKTLFADAPYLRDLNEQHGEWLTSASTDPDASRAAILAEVAEAGRTAEDEEQVGQAMRLAKARLALLAAVAEVENVWTPAQSTAALSDLADATLEAGLDTLMRKAAERGLLTGEGRAATSGLAIFALGKHGGRELNYSSDIDIVAFFDPERAPLKEPMEATKHFTRIVQKLASLMQDRTESGYVFRTDLRLRPDPGATPVALPVDAAMTYYESRGQNWERAAWIKARPCAGDLGVGEAFLRDLAPYVWRKHLDFATIADIQAMKRQINIAKKVGDVRVEGHNVKLGLGGIREIEFFTQTRQLIAGGRDPELRLRGTVEGLAALVEKGWVPADVAETLTRHYRFHRDVEHRVQMVRDAQTHKLPSTDEGFRRLACMMDMDRPHLVSDLTTALTEVHDLTEGFFAPGDASAPTADLDKEEAEIVEGWKAYPALRSSRAVTIFDRLKPDLLAALKGAARPREAIINFDKFLSGLPAGVQLFSLFDSNPTLVDLIVDIAATAPALSVYLGRNAQVLDAVIGGDFFSAWPGESGLRADLQETLDALPDYEAKLDGARRWMKEWHFRIGVHLLRGLTPPAEAGLDYADLADAVVRVIWPLVAEEFARKHGTPPGNGAVLLGMGSLGARTVGPASDLDLIVIYDAPGDAESDGKRPLGSRAYYSRLTQAMVTALSAQMPEGRLYEVDMRLRPSGRQGPVATSLAAFSAYQRDEAWTWEHLALTRARPIAGDMAIGDAVEEVRAEVLGRDRDPARTIADVVEMRARIAEAKGDTGPLDPKIGPGRLQDIELVAQCAAVLAPETPRLTEDQIAIGVEIGWITQDEAEALNAAYDTMRRLQSGAKLITDGTLDLDTVGQGGRAFLFRLMEVEDGETLLDRVTGCAETATKAIEAILARRPGEAA